MDTRFCSGCGVNKSIRGIWYLVPDPSAHDHEGASSSPASGPAGGALSGVGAPDAADSAPPAGGFAVSDGPEGSAGFGRGLPVAEDSDEPQPTAFLCEQCFRGVTASAFDARLDPGVWG